jgi:hypothetical protein
MRFRDRLVDLVLVALSPLAIPFLYFAASKRWKLRLARVIEDAIGVTDEDALIQATVEQ